MASVLELILRSKKQGTGVKDTEKDLHSLEKIAHKVGIAFVAMGAAKIIKSSTLLAARVETLGVVTKKLGENVGMTEEDVRSLEKAIVDQGITLQGSRQAIAMMVQANVDLAHATDLARLAQDTAVIANLNSSEAFQQLTYVLQTGNVRMARTLGLNVQFGKAQQELAKELGKTTAELTEEEIMLARTNAVMKAGTRITGTYEAAMDTAGKKMLSMDRQLEELSRGFGEAFLPILSEVVDKVYEFSKATLKAWDSAKELESAQNYLNAAGIEYAEILKEQGIELTAGGYRTEEYTRAITEMAEKMQRATSRADELMLRLADMGETEVEVEVEITGQAEFVQELETLKGILSQWSREAAQKALVRARISLYGAPTVEEGYLGGEARQHGGDVQSGRSYVVGEREPELFVPRQDGHIYNQQQLAGGDININTGLTQRAFNNMAEDWMRGLGG